MKKKTKKTLTGFRICTAGVIIIAGYLSYSILYENVNYTVASKNARNTYSERIADFDDISLDKDLSKYVFNETGVKIEENEYFKEVNQKISEAATLDELKKIAISYIERYFEYNNSRLDEQSVKISVNEEEKGIITYNDDIMRLDPDAEVVFGNLIKTIDDIKVGTSGLSEEELKKELVKQILTSELYEVVTINEKQLTLRPMKCPNDDFTF